MGKGALTRSRILDEAMRIASRDGVMGLSIGGLAEALDLSKSGLFAHFGSKEALQVAVIEHTGRCFRERVLTPIQTLRPGAQQLRAMLQGWLDWIDSPDLPGGCPILGACFELDDRDGAPREALVALQKGSRKALLEMFRLARDPEQAAFEFKALTLAYHHASRVMRDPKAGARTRKAFEALLERSGIGG